VQITVKAGAPASVSGATLTLILTRGPSATAPNSVSGTFTLLTSNGVVSGSIAGEALLTAGVWRVRGSVRFDRGGGVTAGAGGFLADITLNNPGTEDDTVSWRLDGAVS
jgi:hypothetical protein